ncbi:MAG: prepilin peptidase [Ilumatobacteraceae bacterium]
MWAVPVVWAATVDARVGRLPDGIVLPGMAVVAAVLAVSALCSGRPRPGGPLAGAALLGVPFLLLHLATPTGFGFGDVKYGILLGLGVGLVHPGLVIVVFASAAVFQLVVAWGRLLPAQRVAGADRRSAPFGPTLALAAVGWLLVSLTVGGGR